MKETEWKILCQIYFNRRKILKSDADRYDAVKTEGITRDTSQNYVQLKLLMSQFDLEACQGVHFQK